MLQVENLSFTASGKNILGQVSFSVHPGELFVILGANGAGKSTLLKLITRQYNPSSGHIRLDGKDNRDWRPDELAQRMAILQQQNTLTLPFAVREVVMMGRYPHFRKNPSQVDDMIVDQVLEKAGIAHLAERNYLSLSGGEQQRVHLARAFAQVGDPHRDEVRYLFMDEPSNNLDIRHQHAALSMARAFALEGNCVLAILHDLNLALQYAHRIMLLKHGMTQATGSPQEILNEKIISQVYDMPMQICELPQNGRQIVMPVIN